MDTSFQIDFSLSRLLSGERDPTDYVVAVDGVITTAEQEEAGRLVGYILKVNEALDGGESLGEICDAHSQTLTDYYGALFDIDTGEIKEPIQEQFGGITAGNLLILDRVQVLPAYRKYGVGLAAACSFIDTFGAGYDLAVGLPYPLQFNERHNQWEAKMGYDAFSRDKKLATRKLQNYWSRLGMKRIKGAEIHGSPVYGLSLSMRRPTIADLGVD